MARENPGEIIAVDSSSTDGTLIVLFQYGVRVISNSSNSLGFLRQLGAAAAKGEYVMFVDSDIQLSPGSIERMLHELEKNAWAGIGAMILSAENKSYWQRCEDQKWLDYNRVGPTKLIVTNAALFAKEALQNCPFDPYFCEAAEDADISRRLLAANYTLGISSAVVYHLHRRNFSQYVKQRFRNGLGGARMSLKYNDRNLLMQPLVAAFSASIRDLTKGQINMIPFRLVGGIAAFAGVAAGRSRFVFHEICV